MYIYKTTPSRNYGTLKKCVFFLVLLILSAISFACGQHDDTATKPITLAIASDNVITLAATKKDLPEMPVIATSNDSANSTSYSDSASASASTSSNSINYSSDTSNDVVASSAASTTATEPPVSSAPAKPVASATTAAPETPAASTAPVASTSSAPAAQTSQKTATAPTPTSTSTSAPQNSIENSTAQATQTTTTETLSTAENNNENSNFEILEFVLASKIESREPKEIVENYPAASNNAYAFARLRAKQQAPITFVWIYEGKERARFTTQVQATQKWRTFATTKIRPGNWKVQLLSENKVLAERAFVVE